MYSLIPRPAFFTGHAVKKVGLGMRLANSVNIQGKLYENEHLIVMSSKNGTVYY